MKKFKIGVRYTGYKTFIIEAETEEEAMDKAAEDFDTLVPIKETPAWADDVDSYGETTE